jgi:hypothetical protein
MREQTQNNVLRLFSHFCFYSGFKGSCRSMIGTSQQNFSEIRRGLIVFHGEAGSITPLLPYKLFTLQRLSETLLISLRRPP